jgi:hypothetical protein
MTVAALAIAPLTAAHAEEAEIAVSNSAWYWKSQQSQPVTDPTSGADVVTIEAPNPFCPTTPAGGAPEQTGACEAGRLPVQVAGSEYEEPEMLSLVAFDFALVPIGSTVSDYQVTFLEANDDQSQPANVDGKQIQACLVEQFFGDGDARQYREIPRHTCSDSDPVAERKAVKIKGEDRFEWTFDLTSYAERWAAGELPVAAIALYPVQPKEPNPATDANWRVVLAGPAVENGIATNLVYEAPEDDGLVDPIVDPVTPTDPGSSSTTVGTDFGTGTSTTTTPTTTETPAAGEGEQPVALGDGTAPTGATAAGALPGYVWLGILVGFMAFSLLKQAVMESAAGVRPDGVLAQIQQINANRRGTTAAAVMAASGRRRFAWLRSGVQRVGGALGGLTSKLKRKG